MAKELPFFKFEPNEWENGNIQIVSREDKGLFIDLCAMYWSRLGDLPFRLAVQKLCGGNATAFDSLIEESVFAVVDGQICIDFLNEQIQNFEDLSTKNSENAQKGWEKRRKSKIKSEPNATALPPQSDRNAIREEKRREEKRKEEKKPVFSFKKSLVDFGLDESLVIDYMKNRKALRKACTKTACDKTIKEIGKVRDMDKNTAFRIAVEKGWARFEASWIEKENTKEKTDDYMKRYGG